MSPKVGARETTGCHLPPGTGARGGAGRLPKLGKSRGGTSARPSGAVVGHLDVAVGGTRGIVSPSESVQPGRPTPEVVQRYA